MWINRFWSRKTETKFDLWRLEPTNGNQIVLIVFCFCFFFCFFFILFFFRFVFFFFLRLKTFTQLAEYERKANWSFPGFLLSNCAELFWIVEIEKCLRVLLEQGWFFVQVGSTKSEHLLSEFPNTSKSHGNDRKISPVLFSTLHMKFAKFKGFHLA